MLDNYFFLAERSSQQKQIKIKYNKKTEKLFLAIHSWGWVDNRKWICFLSQDAFIVYVGELINPLPKLIRVESQNLDLGLYSNYDGESERSLSNDRVSTISQP